LQQPQLWLQGATSPESCTSPVGDRSSVCGDRPQAANPQSRSAVFWRRHKE